LDVQPGYRRVHGWAKGRFAQLGRLFELIAYRRRVVDPSAMQVDAGQANPAAIRASRPYFDATLHLCAVSLIAGAIHAVAATDHFGEHWSHGSVLLAIAVAQLGWGAWAYAAPSRATFRTGIGLAGGVAVLWLVSRTVGLPVGPETWQPEAAGVADVAATALEALIAVMCAAFLTAFPQGSSGGALPAPWGRLRPLVMVAMTAGLLAAFIGGGHSH
jgi:hypothetical protein